MATKTFTEIRDWSPSKEVRMYLLPLSSLIKGFDDIPWSEVTKAEVHYQQL